MIVYDCTVDLATDKSSFSRSFVSGLDLVTASMLRRDNEVSPGGLLYRDRHIIENPLVISINSDRVGA